MNDNAEIVHSLYKELIHKYLMVCHKQFLKDTEDRLRVYMYVVYNESGVLLMR